jgi:hypothetical protein
VHFNLGHVGRHFGHVGISIGHHYSSHLSHHSYRSHFGGHYSSHSYRSHYPSFSFRSHYPSYSYSSPRHYSYRSYAPSYRISGYNAPSCLNLRIVAPRVVQLRPTAPIPTAEPTYEQPKVDPPPESLPLPPTSRVAPPVPPATTTALHFAALRSQQTPIPSTKRPQSLNRPTEQLGPQLLTRPTRTLVSDEETPWIAE